MDQVKQMVKDHIQYLQRIEPHSIKVYKAIKMRKTQIQVRKALGHIPLQTGVLNSTNVLFFTNRKWSNSKRQHQIHVDYLNHLFNFWKRRNGEKRAFRRF
jgi:hypothetical protein